MRANREWKDWSSRNFSLDKNKLVWHEYWNFISVSKTFRVVKYTVGFIISVCLKMGFCGRINPTQFHKEQSIYDCDPNSAFFSFMELYFNYVIFFIVTKLRLGWEGGSPLPFGNIGLPVIIYLRACSESQRQQRSGNSLF